MTIVHQFDKLTANKQAQDKVFKNPKINILFEHEPRSFIKEGDKIITEVENVKTKVNQKTCQRWCIYFYWNETQY